MAANKHLGKGLDLLLSATSVKPVNDTHGRIDDAHVEKLFARALDADDEGHTYEAYHLYRTLADYVETKQPVEDKTVCLRTSQALNNAAIILHEAGCQQEAVELLRQACDICPDNAVARENLDITGQ